MAFASVRGFDEFARVAGAARDPRAIRTRLMLLERVLEGLIRLPGNHRIGLDAVIGLVPVAGDLVSATIGTYLVWEARNLGLSRWHCARMMARVGMDAAVGAIPLVGDLFDVVYRANTKNVKTLLAHLDRRHPAGAVVEGVRLPD
jgi:hypothetical protein